MKQNVRGIFLQSWLIGNKGVLKGGGGSTTPTPPPKYHGGGGYYYFLKTEEVQKNGWGMIPANIF